MTDSEGWGRSKDCISATHDLEEGYRARYDYGDRLVLDSRSRALGMDDLAEGIVGSDEVVDGMDGEGKELHDADADERKLHDAYEPKHFKFPDSRPESSTRQSRGWPKTEPSVPQTFGGFALDGAYGPRASSLSMSEYASDEIAQKDNGPKGTEPVQRDTRPLYTLGGSSDAESSSLLDFHGTTRYQKIPNDDDKHSHRYDMGVSGKSNAFQHGQDSADEEAQESGPSSSSSSSEEEDFASPKQGGSASPEQGDLFHRVESKPATSYRSLLTSALHGGGSAQTSQNAASLLQPATQSPHPTVATSAFTRASPRKKELNTQAQARAKPIITTASKMSYPPSMSPRTTRRYMLQAELTAELRQNILWERQQMNASSQQMKKRFSAGISEHSNSKTPEDNSSCLDNFAQEFVKFRRGASLGTLDSVPANTSTVLQDQDTRQFDTKATHSETASSWNSESDQQQDVPPERGSTPVSFSEVLEKDCNKPTIDIESPASTTKDFRHMTSADIALFELEALGSEASYDQELEVLRPDAYEDAPNDGERRSQQDEGERLARLSKLQLEHDSSEEEVQEQRYRQKKKRWDKGIFTRSHSKSVDGENSYSDSDSLDDVHPKSRRLRRRRLRGPRTKGESLVFRDPGQANTDVDWRAYPATSDYLSAGHVDTSEERQSPDVLDTKFTLTSEQKLHQGLENRNSLRSDSVDIRPGPSPDTATGGSKVTITRTLRRHDSGSDMSTLSARGTAPKSANFGDDYASDEVAIEDDDSDSDWEDDDDFELLPSNHYHKVPDDAKGSSHKSHIRASGKWKVSQSDRNSSDEEEQTLSPSIETSSRQEGLTMRTQNRTNPVTTSTSGISSPPATSPRTTRRFMLQAELTADFRQNLLLERQQKSGGQEVFMHSLIDRVESDSSDLVTGSKKGSPSRLSKLRIERDSIDEEVQARRYRQRNIRGSAGFLRPSHPKSVERESSYSNDDSLDDVNPKARRRRRRVRGSRDKDELLSFRDHGYANTNKLKETDEHVEGEGKTHQRRGPPSITSENDISLEELPFRKDEKAFDRMSRLLDSTMNLGTTARRGAGMARDEMRSAVPTGSEQPESASWGSHQQVEERPTQPGIESPASSTLCSEAATSERHGSVHDDEIDPVEDESSSFDDENGGFIRPVNLVDGVGSWTMTDVQRAPMPSYYFTETPLRLSMATPPADANGRAGSEFWDVNFGKISRAADDTYNSVFANTPTRAKSPVQEYTNEGNIGTEGLAISGSSTSTEYGVDDLPEVHLLSHLAHSLEREWTSVQEYLPETWKWDVEYHAGCWTCTPLESDDPKHLPLTIGGAPVILPVEHQWPPMAGVSCPPDPRPSTPIDCTAEVSLEIIGDVFVTFEGSIGFYILISGHLQVMVPDDFDTTWAASHMPHKYGGLKVCYILQNMEATMMPSSTATANTRALLSSPTSSLSSMFRPARPAAVTSNSALNLNDFIEARPKSNHRKEKYSGRISLKVTKLGEQYLLMSTHIITEAILAKSHRDSLFGRNRERHTKLDEDWNEHVDIWAGNERLGRIEKSFDHEAGIYPNGFQHDVTLIKPTSPSTVKDVSSPLPDMGWLNRESWNALRQQVSPVKILAPTETQRSAKSIKCSRPSEILVVGEGIFLNQTAAAGNSKTLKDHDASAWKSLVSRALLYRVYPDFDPPNGYSGLALYADGTREDGTTGLGIVGFQSFVQRSGHVQNFSMEGPALETRLRLGRVAFYGAFEVPDELKRGYTVV